MDNIKNILLDLDGTLTDPKIGIVNCFIYALERLQAEFDPDTDFTRFIGPPLKGSFAGLLKDAEPDEIDSAIRFYRERYREKGQYENEVYSGIRELLLRMNERGYRVFLATSKLESFAANILVHFQLDKFFTGIYGSMEDGTRADKSDLIRYIIEKENLNPKTSVMVGDRHYDIDGAVANGIRSVGVLWGYGDRDELENAGATAVCSEVSQLDAIVSALT